MMGKLHLYNFLTRAKEEFTPINPPKVGMYTCGPTIYDYPHVGNWRTYILSDILYRALKFNGYEVKHVMNLTDVGHLSGDNLGDSSQGEDRMSKAAKKEGVDAWAIAGKYEKDFVDSFDKLNIIKPDVIPRATDHIKEQIALVKRIEKKGLVYRISDGIYFDVRAYEALGNEYGVLSNLDELHVEGQRIEPNPEKKDPRDFALWKFFATGQKRHGMEWNSPWGVGYPGWHIECSAMSMKYLGEQFDIHLGGEGLRSTHHPNEIAQSEAATGKTPFVKYWIHGAFLLVDGGKMGKSLGNAYTLHDLDEKGFVPLALRYFCLTGHYRKQINFTWEVLESARTALYNLYRKAPPIGEHTFDKDEGELVGSHKYYIKFKKAVNDDLNIPQALALVWELLDDKSVSDRIKALLLEEFDEVLGLQIYSKDHSGLFEKLIPFESLPNRVKNLINDRENLRKARKYKQADEIRSQIESLGYVLEDSPDGLIIKAVMKNPEVS